MHCVDIMIAFGCYHPQCHKMASLPQRRAWDNLELPIGWAELLGSTLPAASVATASHAVPMRLSGHDAVALPIAPFGHVASQAFASVAVPVQRVVSASATVPPRFFCSRLPLRGDTPLG